MTNAKLSEFNAKLSELDSKLSEFVPKSAPNNKKKRARFVPVGTVRRTTIVNPTPDRTWRFAIVVPVFSSEPFPDEPGRPVPRLYRLGQLMNEWVAEAVAAREAFTTGAARGPVTGMAHLDGELGGALSPGMHVMHGGPGVGKTAMALQIAATCGCPAIYTTCEMGPLEIFRRHIARMTNTFLGRLRSGEFTPAAATELARGAVEAAPLLAIVDATRAFAAPSWLAQAARVVRGDATHLLVVIDSIHAWAGSAPGDGVSEYERLNAAVDSLRVLGGELGCAVLGIAERNRMNMTTGGLSASAGSRKFEYGGESVWELNRKEDAVPDGAGEVAVTLRLVKNRNGSPNRKVDLLFHGALQRWREAGRSE
jgi:replicative DNA helicase